MLWVHQLIALSRKIFTKTDIVEFQQKNQQAAVQTIMDVKRPFTAKNKTIMEACFILGYQSKIIDFIFIFFIFLYLYFILSVHFFLSLTSVGYLNKLHVCFQLLQCVHPIAKQYTIAQELTLGYPKVERK